MSEPAIGPDAEYQAYLRQGRFMIQRSRSTGAHVFYPRIAAPGTGETGLEWVEASGGGAIYAITVNRAREGAYNIALIDLDEGPRMMSRVDGALTAPIGARVRARVADLPDGPAVVFDLVA